MKFRANSSDIAVIEEIVFKHSYRRTFFDVQPGELWLDLGANIGAFALYCESRKARAICFEPDADCFNLLTQNTKFPCFPFAVSGFRETTMPFFVGTRQGDYYRNTIVPTKNLKPHSKTPSVDNLYGSFLNALTFDGVKMDIEGSEGLLLDNGFLPQCNKLVMEYHTSRDSSADNLHRRLAYLQKQFKNVRYPPEYDRTKTGTLKTFFDRLIFCWN